MINGNAMADNTLWQVTSIQDGTIFTSQGPRPAKDVYMKVMGGVTTKITIPDSEFNAEKVNEMCHQLAVEIVKSLGLRAEMPAMTEQYGSFTEIPQQ